jgi:hypothetical protein
MQAQQQIVDHVFEALSRAPRRGILATLVEASSREVPEEALHPEALGEEEAEREAFVLSLRHHHLPHLDELGFIDWERGAQMVHAGPKYDQIAPIVEQMIEMQDQHPAAWVPDEWFRTVAETLDRERT